MAKYKWQYPYEWLTEAARGWDQSKLYHELCGLAEKLDSDTLQDFFESEMDAGGYFNELEA